MAKDKPVPQPYAKADQVPVRGDQIFSPLRQKLLKATPEERVRQEFIKHLHDHYGYKFEQMDQERKTQHGRGSPRTDIVVYAAPGSKTPIVVVECKAESVNIHLRDYYQGESYARATGCEFFVTHNQRQTAIFKLVPGTPGEAVQINDLPHAEDWGDAKRIEAIKNSTRAFSRKEFQDLLFKCHSILRDVHKMEPGRAFDAISKILFIKMYIERTGTWGTFTTDYLDKRNAVRLPTDKAVHEQLFDQTKQHYETSEIFSGRDELEVSEETFRRIVTELARFNLSATGDDIKGLAFERFLGDTFRGELGQFFTPRPIVDFMVDLLDPQEGELICDPAAGSGGFLIRAFEHVRNKISDDVQAKKDAFRETTETKHLKEDDELSQIEVAFIRFNRELDPEQTDPPSRVRKLAYDCIFGTDAEPRAARTAKMNMIMHGDGHGGIHYHDGLVDINGVFTGRFNVVLTNPPFGQNVGEDQKFGGSEETRVPNDDAYCKRSLECYGEGWQASHNRTLKLASLKTTILDSFEVGKDKPNRPTEILFLERCIQLLRPGGRMGIVLPDGNLNNPSLSWLRRWAEGKARLLAVVSLPEETFRSAEATVKASLVFLRRFTETDEDAWEDAWRQAHARHDHPHNADRSRLCSEYGLRIACGDSADLAKIIRGLEDIGIQRQLPDWKKAEPPRYPRGVGSTTVGKPRWTGEATDKKRGRELKKQFEESWTDQAREKVEALHRELRAALRKVDIAHNAALWREVRELFDYPVFTAAPETVGITSTGAEGPNQLSEVLTQWRAFQRSKRVDREKPTGSKTASMCSAKRFLTLGTWVAGENRRIWRTVYPLRRLDTVLVEQCETMEFHKDLGEWQAITIHFDGEIVPRDRKAVFKGKMFAARSGDLVFSKIDARNGAIGILPPEIPKAVVTTEYPVHVLRTGLIDPHYLALILRSPKFLDELKRAASGTSGRKRVTPEAFRSIEIPLPDLETQRCLGAAYWQADTALKKAQALKRQAWIEFLGSIASSEK